LKPRISEESGVSCFDIERENQGETVVLLHGFGCNKDFWTAFAKYPKGYHWIIPDPPRERCDPGKESEELQNGYPEGHGALPDHGEA